MPSTEALSPKPEPVSSALAALSFNRKARGTDPAAASLKFAALGAALVALSLKFTALNRQH